MFKYHTHIPKNNFKQNENGERNEKRMNDNKEKIIQENKNVIENKRSIKKYTPQKESQIFMVSKYQMIAFACLFFIFRDYNSHSYSPFERDSFALNFHNLISTNFILVLFAEKKKTKKKNRYPPLLHFRNNINNFYLVHSDRQLNNGTKILPQCNRKNLRIKSNK